MSDAAWSMAQAFRLTVEEMGNVSIALGGLRQRWPTLQPRRCCFRRRLGIY